MKTSKILIAAALAAAASVAMADTIATISYGGGRSAEVYTGGGGNGVYVRTHVSSYSTGFTKNKNPSSSDCAYTHANGSCYSESRMISEIQSKVTSGGGYNR